eukprot:2023728-Lingulodinium_polyedra.AAC.1
MANASPEEMQALRRNGDMGRVARALGGEAFVGRLARRQQPVSATSAIVQSEPVDQPHQVCVRADPPDRKVRRQLLCQWSAAHADQCALIPAPGARTHAQHLGLHAVPAGHAAGDLGMHFVTFTPPSTEVART